MRGLGSPRGLTSRLLDHLVAVSPLHVAAAHGIAVAELQIRHVITFSDLGLRFLQRERSDMGYGQALRHGDFVVRPLRFFGHASYPAAPDSFRPPYGGIARPVSCGGNSPVPP